MKCNSCINGYNGGDGKGYQPCGCSKPPKIPTECVVAPPEPPKPRIIKYNNIVGEIIFYGFLYVAIIIALIGKFCGII